MSVDSDLHFRCYDVLAEKDMVKGSHSIYIYM
jgi:hypothetical protein